jgi:choline-sulfatase
MTTSRRDVLKAGAALAARGARAAPRRPHLLLLMADQFRADCLGLDGNRAIRTPNLDRIGREGVRFRSAYSSTPTCTPARAALLTGMSPWHHGMLGYSRVGERYPVEMPRLLREAGYYTLGIGKMHYHPQRNLHGFHQTILDESGRIESPDYRGDYRGWFWSEAPTLDPDATGIGWNSHRSAAYALPERLHPTVWTAAAAIRFLDSYNRPEPFFLKVSFARPHSPYDPPERFWKMYQDAALPAARVGRWAARYAPKSDDTENLWHGDLGAAQVRRSRQGYYGSVAFLDEQIGRILEALERRGLLEETLILFTSDHGDMTGDHNLWRKSYAYESSARIPMMMRWPAGLVSAKRGQSLGQTVEIRDILPTFCQAAGVSVPETVDGRSMLALANGASDGWRPYLDLEHDVCYSPSNHWNALTDGRWKYIYHARDGEEQLFDLQTDPAEMDDLAPLAAHEAELRRWRARLVAHLAERGDQWVKGGRLVPRARSILHSPNYPG